MRAVVLKLMMNMISFRFKAGTNQLTKSDRAALDRSVISLTQRIIKGG
jgi:hypothetical protein